MNTCKIPLYVDKFAIVTLDVKNIKNFLTVDT